MTNVATDVAVKLAADICDFLDALDRLCDAYDYLDYKQVVMNGIESLFNGEANAQG